MHLTFGTELGNSIRREFDKSIKKRNAFHNIHFDAAKVFLIDFVSQLRA